MSNNVKLFSSARAGAPIVSNNWGDLTNMLDACLINGYNHQTIKSTSGTGTSVTATLPSGHGFQESDVVDISGATLAPPIQNPLNSTANVAALLHFDGANNSTVFKDECNNIWTPLGSSSTIISTTQSKIGGSAAYFNGNALTCTSNNLVFGTNDLTIEMYVYFPIINVQQNIFDTRPLGINGLYIALYLSSNKITFHSNNVDRIQSSVITANTWYHLALVRTAGVFSMYINGTKLGTTYADASMYNSNTTYLGYSTFDSTYYTLYIDELLIMNGTAKYSANFTAPTTAYGLNVYGVSSTTTLGETVISKETYCLNTVTNPVITWQTLPGATGYKVWKGLGSQLESEYFNVVADTTTFTDTGAAGTTASIPTGVTQIGINGEYTLTSTTSTTVTFQNTSTVNFSGTIKFAPLGFQTVYTGLNKRVYKSQDVTSTQNLLRVDNSLDPAYTTTYAKYAKVTVCDSMSDIDTFNTQNRMPYHPSYPTINEIGTGSGATSVNGWFKWYHSNQVQNTASTSASDSSGDGGVGARNWYLVGDSKLFFIVISDSAPSPTEPLYPWTYSFGDINSFKPSDSFRTFLLASDIPYSSNQNLLSKSIHNDISTLFKNTPSLVINGVGGGNILNTGAGLLKSYNGLGGWVSSTVTSVLNSPINNGASGDSSFLSPLNTYAINLSPVYCVEHPSGHEIRGIIPGVYHILQEKNLGHGTILSNIAGYPNKRFIFLNSSGNTTAQSQIAFDITGPW